MPHFAGLDVSKATTHICILDHQGSVIKEGATETKPAAIVGFLRGERRRYVRVGFEAGDLASGIYEALCKARLPGVCIETRHASTALRGQRNKTDGIDARGIATLMRTANYRRVHIKSAASREIRAILAVRTMLVGKIGDIENGIRAHIAAFGLKLPHTTKANFSRVAGETAEKSTAVAPLIESLLRVRAVLVREKTDLDRLASKRAQDDEVCRRLMTAPQVGAITALAFRAAIDEPNRFGKSRSVGAHLGMTPRTYQSGETERRGRITKWGDGSVRRMLVLAARGLFRKNTRKSWLAEWATAVAARRGKSKAIVAAARRLAVILHKMWVTETDFHGEGNGKGLARA